MSFRKGLPLKLSPKARHDFIDILRYTGETWGPQQLQIYRGVIDNALQVISQNPQLGHWRDDLPEPLRAYLVGSHVIIYRIGENEVGVVRILHKRMSLTKNVRADPHRD